MIGAQEFKNGLHDHRHVHLGEFVMPRLMRDMACPSTGIPEM